MPSDRQKEAPVWKEFLHIIADPTEGISSMEADSDGIEGISLWGDPEALLPQLHRRAALFGPIPIKTTAILHFFRQIVA
jgi:hypothetical protein